MLSCVTARVLLAVSLLLSACSVFGAALEQIISREQKEMAGTGAQLGVGRDGHVFVIKPGFLLRFNPDGSGKVGHRVSYAAMNATANANGILAVSASHMDATVWMYSPGLEELARAREFMGSDLMGWFSPSDVQVGPSGDFYAPDPHRRRAVRIAPTGKTVAEFSLKATGEEYKHTPLRLRVAEPLQRLYVASASGVLMALGFDGKKIWAITPGIQGHPYSWKDYEGDFDVDDAGNVYVLKVMTDVVEVFDKDGKPSGKIQLEMGDRRGRQLSLRVTAERPGSRTRTARAANGKPTNCPWAT